MIRKTFMVPISLLLLLLFNSNIFSQTIIKERVGIKSHELNFKSIRSDTLKNLKIGDPVLSANIQSGEEVLKTTKVTLPFEGYATVTIGHF